ncbi:MAG: hypothetical protein K8H74_12475 [Notoacmeibacter sp.]|nr:hypothetical protein [Notoacmeibacter sp.]
MTEAEKIQRDINKLREAVSVDWADLSRLSLTPEQTLGILRHVGLCIDELKDLYARLHGLHVSTRC